MQWMYYIFGNRRRKTYGINLSASPYAGELQKGFPLLRFTGTIEKEFRESYCLLIKPRFRVALLTGFILIITFEILDRVLLADHAVIWTTVVRFGVLMPVLAVSGIAIEIKRFRRKVLSLVFITALIAGLGIITIFIINYHIASYIRYESLILTTAVVYFVTGLLFRENIACCGLVMAVYLTAAIVSGINASIIVSSGLFLLLMNIIGAGGSYIIERAIRSNYLHRKILKNMAEHDGLTGIYNRHTFNERYDRLWRQAARDRKSVAVIMIDVDWFKHYNDTHGHLAGDQCLIRIASTLAQYERRPLDIVARFGGEEFVVVLYDTTIDHVRDTSEMIRNGVDTLGIDREGPGDAHHVTISIGCAIMAPAQATEPQELIRRADEALYQAKNRGRNMAVTAVS